MDPQCPSPAERDQNEPLARSIGPARVSYVTDQRARRIQYATDEEALPQ